MITEKEIKDFFRANKCPNEESLACEAEQIIDAEGKIVGLRLVPVNGGKILNIREIQPY